MKTLVVEDEVPIANFVKNGLEENGFIVEVCHRGDEAAALIKDNIYDAIVLDIMLPGMTGLRLLRDLRGAANAVPVLFLTARSGLTEKIEGLDLGADDYITKPFAIDELAARLRAIVRRDVGQHYSVYEVGDLKLDLSSRTAKRGTRLIDLTLREFSVLECLMRTPNRVFTRSQLYERVWEYHFEADINLIEVYIRKLRRKIDDGESIKLIHTERGVGYKIAKIS